MTNTKTNFTEYDEVRLIQTYVLKDEGKKGLTLKKIGTEIDTTDSKIINHPTIKSLVKHS